jgi:hypothetical protein
MRSVSHETVRGALGRTFRLRELQDGMGVREMRSVQRHRPGRTTTKNMEMRSLWPAAAVVLGGQRRLGRVRTVQVPDHQIAATSSVQLHAMPARLLPLLRLRHIFGVRPATIATVALRRVPTDQRISARILGPRAAALVRVVRGMLCRTQHRPCRAHDLEGGGAPASEVRTRSATS